MIYCSWKCCSAIVIKTRVFFWLFNKTTNYNQALEALLVRCPQEMAPALEELIALSLELLAFDPNYNYCDEDNADAVGLHFFFGFVVSKFTAKMVHSVFFFLVLRRAAAMRPL